MSNILILSSYTKEETESCIDQLCEKLGSVSLKLDIYVGGLARDTGPAFSLYDQKHKEIKFDEAVVFSPTDFVSMFEPILEDIPVYSVSGITPSSWRSKAKNTTLNYRKKRLGSFLYPPKNAAFQCDPMSLSFITCRALNLVRKQIEGRPLPNVEWRSTDNRIVIFTGEEFIAFADAVDEYVEQVYVESWASIDE